MIQLTPQERDIYRRYARLALPRHTSYPTAPFWQEDYQTKNFLADLEKSLPGKSLSLYVHLPFCEKLCYYCACTKEIVPFQKRREKDPVDELLQGLEIEAQRLQKVLKDVPFSHIHLGGGSPTYLSVSQLEQLGKLIANRFTIHTEAEKAVEIDPRITSFEQLQLLRSMGFNRISLGIQDFDPKVQKAVNRIQPFEKVQEMVSWCRSLKFDSVNFDLIYGLPYQTCDSLNSTLDKTLSMSPDRIAFYRLAVIPEIFRWQNVFKNTDLPAGDLPLELNLLAIRRFTEAGYDFIGLDHFAKPGEGLAQAREEGTLQRNFQGMTTGKSLELIGMGPSAISQLEYGFSQNIKSSEDWRAAIHSDFAIERGLHLSLDDRIRRELMQQLYGYGRILFQSLGKRFCIEPENYFAREIEACHELEKEGLVIRDGSDIALTPGLGRLLVRVVAAVFDAYLPPGAHQLGLLASQSSKVG